MSRVLLDTNAYTAYLSGDRNVLDEMSRADQTLLPVTTLGELYAGFEGGSRFAENKKILEQFLAKPGVEVVNSTHETARVFGSIKAELRSAGTPLPINDVWLAAHAVEQGAVLITYDRHFEAVSRVRLWIS